MLIGMDDFRSDMDIQGCLVLGWGFAVSEGWVFGIARSTRTAQVYLGNYVH